MASDLTKVLDKVTKIVNFIKARPPNSRIFNLMCEELGNTYKTRWLLKSGGFQGRRF